MEGKKRALGKPSFLPNSDYFRPSEVSLGCILGLAKLEMHPLTQIPGTFMTRFVWLVTQCKSTFRRITSPPIWALSLWNKILGAMENAKRDLVKKTSRSGLSPESKESFVRKITDKPRFTEIHHNSQPEYIENTELNSASAFCQQIFISRDMTICRATHGDE